MTPLRTALLGSIAYAVFLLATLPASVVTARAQSASQGRVSFSGATGTAWSGTAAAHVQARGLAFDIDELRWQFRPLRLLSGEASWAISARMPELAASVEASHSPWQMRFRDLRASGDAAVLARIFAPAGLWQPSGAITVEAADVTLDGKVATGKATAEWRDAALALAQARPLGTWRAEATGEGPGAKITLATLRGPLRVSGTGSVNPPGRFVFSGEARAEAGRERELEDVLKLLGARRPDGAHAIELR